MKPLQVDCLSKNYNGITAVDRLSFNAAPHQVTVWLGPNGSGKTTLMRMICGLLPPDSGRISLFGQPMLLGDPSRTSIVGYCPQKLSLWYDLTVFEQLRYLADIYGVNKKKQAERISIILTALELQEKSKISAGKLSGGMQRRLNLALALIHQPKLLILDEPFNGLDVTGRLLVRRLILSLAHKQKTTVMLTTHDINDAELFADRVCIMHKGRLLAHESTETLKKQHADHQKIKIVFRSARDLSLPEVRQFLDRGDLPTRIEGDTLYLKTTDPGLFVQLMSEFKQRKIETTAIVVQEPNLEDVFLSLTGDSLDHDCD